MNKVYRCSFIYSAKFLDKENQEYYIDETLSDIEIEADDIKDLFFGLIHCSNDYTQENYKSKDFQKSIKSVNDEAIELPSELEIKSIDIQQVLDLIEIGE